MEKFEALHTNGGNVKWEKQFLEVKNRLTRWSSSLIPKITVNVYSHKNLNAHSNNICNSPKVETPKCLSVDERRNVLRIHMMKYYLAVEREWCTAYAAIWVNAENIMLIERSLWQKTTWSKFYEMSRICKSLGQEIRRRCLGLGVGVGRNGEWLTVARGFGLQWRQCSKLRSWLCVHDSLNILKQWWYTSCRGILWYMHYISIILFLKSKAYF